MVLLNRNNLPKNPEMDIKHPRFSTPFVSAICCDLVFLSFNSLQKEISDFQSIAQLFLQIATNGATFSLSAPLCA